VLFSSGDSPTSVTEGVCSESCEETVGCCEASALCEEVEECSAAEFAEGVLGAETVDSEIVIVSEEHPLSASPRARKAAENLMPSFKERP